MAAEPIPYYLLGYTIFSRKIFICFERKISCDRYWKSNYHEKQIQLHQRIRENRIDFPLILKTDQALMRAAHHTEKPFRKIQILQLDSRIRMKKLKISHLTS